MNPYSWSLTDDDLAPLHDFRWYSAPVALKKRFYTRAKALVLAAKRSQLAQGLDKDGNPLAALRYRTIQNRRSAMGPADRNAPPLVPAGPLSRTSAYLRATAFADKVVFYWANGFGRILNYHRQGSANLPVRDVFGLAAHAVAIVKHQMLTWWNANRKGITPVLHRKTENLVVDGKTYTLAGRDAAGIRAAQARGQKIVFRRYEDLTGRAR